VPAFSQWVDMHIPVNGSVKAVAIKDSVIFASAAEGRFLMAKTTGDQWIEPATNMSGIIINTFHVNGNDIFAGTLSAGLFRSTDDGASWVNLGLSVNNIYSVSVFDSTLYVSSFFGVHSSKDNGSTWVRLNSILSTKGVLLHKKRLYCISAEKGLFISDDSGKTWNTPTSSVASNALSAIIEHENDIYISTLGAGVFRSSDNGESWNSVNVGLSNFDLLALASNGDVLFGGTYGGGVFASNNKGKLWAPVNTGVTDFHVYSFAKNDSMLFMASGNSGVWRRPLRQFINLQSGVEMQRSNTLAISCFPNPFNTSTAIRYTLNNTEKVLVEIFDILGRKILTLVDRTMDEGGHVVSFNAASLPKGIYYAKLTTSTAQSQIKMVLSD
jgi:photosystem II stability/assembly factor-like uncharacterized protein